MKANSVDMKENYRDRFRDGWLVLWKMDADQFLISVSRICLRFPPVPPVSAVPVIVTNLRLIQQSR